MEMCKCENCIGTRKLGFCEFCDDNDNYRRMTNADRIRAMSDEELVDILNWNVLNSGNCLYWEDGRDWLKQEVE